MDDLVIGNLKLTSEYLGQLQGMINREQARMCAEYRLADKAKHTVDETIYKLTGDEFYRNQIGGTDETGDSNQFPA